VGEELVVTYHLEGQMLEVCDCRVLCPCWIGEDPDNGTCESMLAYQIDKGTIDGMDVSGHTVAVVAHIPGNALKGDYRAAIYVDDRTSPEQEKALLDVYTGKQGGPAVELSSMFGEVVSVRRVPITYAVDQGRGTLKIADVGFADMVPYLGPNGAITTLSDTIYSTIPGAPVFVSKATRFVSKDPLLGHDFDISGFNALQTTFVLDG
jgi:hypothetical protein